MSTQAGAQPQRDTDRITTLPNADGLQNQDLVDIPLIDQAIALLSVDVTSHSDDSVTPTSSSLESSAAENAANHPGSGVNEPNSQLAGGAAAEHADIIVQPLSAGIHFQGLPLGWERRWTADKGRRYYVDHNTRTTTWEAPAGAKSFLPSEDPVVERRGSEVEERYAKDQQKSEDRVRESTSQYKDRLLRQAAISQVTWNPPNPSKLPRFFLGARWETSATHDGTDLGRLLDTLDDDAEQKIERVCIVENITEPWLLSVGAHLDLPPMFLLWHTCPSIRSGMYEIEDIANQYLNLVDDIVDRLFRLSRHLSAVIEKQRTLSMLTTENGPISEGEQPILSLLDNLSRRSRLARSRLSQWVYAGAPHKDERELSAEINTMNEVYVDLQTRNTASPTLRFEIMIRAIESTDASIQKFIASQSESWYSIPVVPVSVNGYQTLAARGGNHVTGLDECGSLSYIRAHKSLVLILLDHKPKDVKLITETLESNGPYWRDKLQMQLPAMDGYNRRTIDLPTLFTSADGGVFESLAAFTRNDWHLEILCNEEELLPMYDLHEQSGAQKGAIEPSRYAALRPQAFMFLLSSFLWGANMTFLEIKGRRISFFDIRNLGATDATKINSELNDCREDLDYLIETVSDTDSQTPADLAAYYDEFPRIRWRHKETYLSPIDHHKKILERARTLEKLLIDSFQMLMSSVSVQQATLGNEQAAISAKLASASVEQARAATRITALAFVYIPLTFVTGIFGMNIRIGTEEPKGFIWYAPLVTLGVAILFTAALWYAADWVETRLDKRRQKRKQDVEGGQRMSKAKAE
ncbi:hypothetical protein MBLNU13_g09342t2 [Cladosporium sp. NU13]